MKDVRDINIYDRLDDARQMGWTNLRMITFWWEGKGYMFAIAANPRTKGWRASGGKDGWLSIYPYDTNPYSFASAYLKAIGRPQVKILRAEYIFIN